MRARNTIIAVVAGAVAAISLACGPTGSRGGEKVIKSTTSADMTIALANASGELKTGEGDLILSFTDSSSRLVDVGAASLKFHMPGMGTMAEMNDEASLTTTETPGKYRARVNIEMRGTWESIISYEGPHGTGRATMTVNVR